MPASSHALHEHVAARACARHLRPSVSVLLAPALLVPPKCPLCVAAYLGCRSPAS